MHNAMYYGSVFETFHNRVRNFPRASTTKLRANPCVKIVRHLWKYLGFCRLWFMNEYILYDLNITFWVEDSSLNQLFSGRKSHSTSISSVKIWSKCRIQDDRNFESHVDKYVVISAVFVDPPVYKRVMYP